MWALYATAGAVAVILGIALPLAFHARKQSRKLGEANGEVEALEAIITDREREIEAMRIALDRALNPPPTLDDLDRVSALQAGDSARPGAAAAIRVP